MEQSALTRGDRHFIGSGISPPPRRASSFQVFPIHRPFTSSRWSNGINPMITFIVFRKKKKAFTFPVARKNPRRPMIAVYFFLGITEFPSEFYSP